ncbi:N-acetyltransferase [Plasmodium gonderi]|uniref:N-acetyltransferase n=1 Tax=Plasmodium gonderi TaxID=77519 RepID=A0A1Y1JK15_PLAGO|nr:N-acetyltransferase [Plasmodium gonderi]GAW82866.1 N-acetyltransferase [Plasmodium gonderi]
MNIFKQKEKAPSSISHILMNKQKTRFPEPLITIRQLEEKDINEVRQLLHDHFNSLTLPAVIYWSIQHIYDLLVIVVINYIFFLDLKKIFYFLIIFLIYLYLRAKLEFLNHIRKDCPDLENLYKSYINVEGCNFWVAEVFDNNFGSASRTTCSDIHERDKILLEQEEQEKLLCNDRGDMEMKNSDEENNKYLNDISSKNAISDPSEKPNELKTLNKNKLNKNEENNSCSNNSETEKDTHQNGDNKNSDTCQNTNWKDNGAKVNLVNIIDHEECTPQNYNDIYYKTNNNSPFTGVDVLTHGTDKNDSGNVITHSNKAHNVDINNMNNTKMEYILEEKEGRVVSSDDKSDIDSTTCSDIKGKESQKKNDKTRHCEENNNEEEETKVTTGVTEEYNVRGNTYSVTNEDRNCSSSIRDNNMDIQNNKSNESEEKTKLLCNIGEISNKELIESRRTVPFRLNEIRKNIFNRKTNDDDDSNFRFMTKKIVGCVGIVPFKGDNSIAQLVRMVVKKDNRRMRIGSRLLTQLENFAHEQNYQELKVFTNNLNTDSLYFVKQNGFNLSQIVRRGLMRGDLLIWSKILNKDDFYKFNSSGTNHYVKSMNLGEY